MRMLHDQTIDLRPSSLQRIENHESSERAPAASDGEARAHDFCLRSASDGEACAHDFGLRIAERGARLDDVGLFAPCVRRLAGALMGVALLSFSGSAHAGDRATAQALFDAGKKLVAAHDYTQACPKFEESQRLDPAIGTLLNLADCYEQQGRLAAAWAAFLEAGVRAKTAGQSTRVQIAHDRAEALSARVPRLVLQVPAADKIPALELKRDGEVVGRAQWGEPIPVDPGPHVISAAAQGFKPWSQSVTLAESAKLAVSVPELARETTPSTSHPTTVAPRTEPNPGEPSQPSQPLQPNQPEQPNEQRSGLGSQKILAIVSATVGVAGIGVGSVFGLQSISKHKKASDACPSTCANTSDQGLWNDAVRAGNISTIAFIAGGVGLAGAAVLWFTAPKGESRQEPSVAFGLAPGSVRVKAVW